MTFSEATGGIVTYLDAGRIQSRDSVTAEENHLHLFHSIPILSHIFGHDEVA
jgi:hypothetical protein